MAQPWPPWMHDERSRRRRRPKSASSSNRLTDLPPSSRNIGFSVAAAACHDAAAGGGRAGEGHHVDVGRGRQHLADEVVADVTMLTTPGGMSVFSAMSRPMRVAFHGVSGAGLSTRCCPWPGSGRAC